MISTVSGCVSSSIEAVLKQPVSEWIYISRTVFILPLSVCIETATKHMDLRLRTVLISPLGACIETTIWRIGLHLLDSINIATGRMY